MLLAQHCHIQRSKQGPPECVPDLLGCSLQSASLLNFPKSSVTIQSAYPYTLQRFWWQEAALNDRLEALLTMRCVAPPAGGRVSPA